MLALDDDHWQRMLGGYRVPIDPRPAFAKLRTDVADADAWKWLWNELHHQGDVGEASYAAVPILVSIYLEANQGRLESARSGRNRGVGPRLGTQSFSSGVAGRRLCRRIASTGCALPFRSAERPAAGVDTRDVGHRGHLAGARTYARVLLDFSEDEVRELEELAYGAAE
jgi:hypothetical protein